MRRREKKLRKYKNMVSRNEMDKVKTIHPCTNCYYNELTLDLESMTATRKCNLNLQPSMDCVWSDSMPKTREVSYH